MINDHYCVYKYDVDIPSDVSINDVIQAICKQFNCEASKGKYCGNPQIEQFVDQSDEIEAKINETKRFVNMLSRLQDHCFERLVTELTFNDKGEEMLFDYVYNSGEEGLYLNFEEWVSFYKYTTKEFLSK